MESGWICPTCFQSYSRKFSLERHIRTCHREASYHDAVDNSSTTPAKRRDIAVDDADTSQTDDTSAAGDREDMVIVDEEMAADTSSYDSSIIGSSTDESDSYETSNVDSESSVESEDGCDSISPNELWETGSPGAAGINHTEHVLVTLSYATRHNLNQTQRQDLIELIKLHCPNETILTKSPQDLISCFAGCIPVLQFHDMCELCYFVFPQDEDVWRCPTRGCDGLRFQGALHKQSEKKRKCYFVTVPVEEQLEDILKRSGVWQSIQESFQARRNNGNIRDIKDGLKYRELCKEGGILESMNHLSTLLNTDGIPIFKSSKVGVWPLFMVINELPPEERFLKKNTCLWGLWQGKGKPIMDAFQKPLVQTMNRLASEGFKIQELSNNTFYLHGILSTLDLQGRSYWLNMVPHNGEYGCAYCDTPGKVVKSGKGHCRCYPYDQFTSASLRTEESFYKDADMADRIGKTVRGIKGRAIATYIRDYNVVDGTVIDYMHGLLLGVMKSLLTLWLSPSADNKKKNFFIGHKMKTIDKRLIRMKPSDLVCRYPRRLQANLHHLKASEFKAWLLYYGVPCLTGILPDEYLAHFCLLVAGTHILLGDNITPEELEMAEKMFRQFYKGFSLLYGESKCGINVHNVVHYAALVRNWGPLWGYSCFSFEDLNGDCVNAVHGTRDIARQIISAFLADKQLQLYVQSVDKIALSEASDRFVGKMLTRGRRPQNVTAVTDCQLVGKTTKHIISADVKELLRPDLRDPELSWQKVLRVILRGKVYYSSQYSRAQKRINYAVLWQEPSGDLSPALVQYFLYNDETATTIAVLERLMPTAAPTAVGDSAPHIIFVKKSRPPHYCATGVGTLQEKVNFLDGNKAVNCVVRAPNMVERE